MSKNQLVLCVKNTDTIKNNKTNFIDISDEDFCMFNRKVVDNIDDIQIGSEYLQIIPLIVLYSLGHYLIYERQGSETRLHNKYSITLGGHVDLEDVLKAHLSTKSKLFQRAVAKAATRELFEEIGFDYLITQNDFKHLIYVPKDDVSKVHLGALTFVEVPSHVKLQTSTEIGSFKWFTKQQLKANIDKFELWSQHIINNILL